MDYIRFQVIRRFKDRPLTITSYSITCPLRAQAIIDKYKDKHEIIMKP